MDSDKVLACHDTVLILSSCIYDLGCKFLALVLDDFAEGVLDGGIVAINKVIVDELHC